MIYKLSFQPLCLIGRGQYKAEGTWICIMYACLLRKCLLKSWQNVGFEWRSPIPPFIDEDSCNITLEFFYKQLIFWPASSCLNFPIFQPQNCLTVAKLFSTPALNFLIFITLCHLKRWKISFSAPKAFFSLWTNSFHWNIPYGRGSVTNCLNSQGFRASAVA